MLLVLRQEVPDDVIHRIGFGDAQRDQEQAHLGCRTHRAPHRREASGDGAGQESLGFPAFAGDDMRTVIEADERNGVQVTTQRFLLTAQEFVQLQHPLVGLRLKEGLSQVGHHLLRPDLVDIEFAHQVPANLGRLYLGDVIRQPSRDLRTEQRSHLFRAEQFAQLLRSRQLGLRGGDTDKAARELEVVRAAAPAAAGKESGRLDRLAEGRSFPTSARIPMMTTPIPMVSIRRNGCRSREEQST